MNLGIDNCSIWRDGQTNKIQGYEKRDLEFFYKGATTFN